MFFRQPAGSGTIEIVCPKCKRRISGKVKVKCLLQDVKLKDVEIEV
jgi:hypothetical protein